MKESGRVNSITVNTALPSAWKLRAIRILKPLMFVLALCMTVVLFSLPTVFYYYTAYGVEHGSEDAIISHETFSSNKSISAGSSDVDVSCDTISWGIVEPHDEDHIKCEMYTGEQCRPYLVEWDTCLVQDDEGTSSEGLYVGIGGVVTGGKTQAILDQEIAQLQTLLVSFPDCQALAMPFVCHYYYPLLADPHHHECPPSSSDSTQQQPQLYTVTREDCLHLQDTICTVPWSLATTLGLGDRLPDCGSLPLGNITAQDDDINMMNLTLSNYSSTVTSNQSIVCRDDFMLINSTCYPRCDRFEELPHDTIKVIVGVELASAVIGFTLSMTALVISVWNRENMFKFPSILLVFFSMDMLSFALIVLIQSVDKFNLMCSSNNLIEAIRNPTVFCTITGVVFQYTFINMGVWWIFHLCVFFYEVMFPFHANRFRKLGNTKKLGAILITIGFIIPLPAAIVPLVSKEHRFSLVRFPPSICLADETTWLFYSFTFPFSIAIATGVCLLIIIIWMIHLQGISVNIGHTRKKHHILTIAEKKMITVFVCFVVFGTVSLAHYAVVSGNAYKVTQGFASYFLCEAAGHVPGKCNRSSFERHLYPHLLIITYILMSLIPIAILNFVLNWEKFLKTGRNKFNGLQKQLSSARTLIMRPSALNMGS